MDILNVTEATAWVTEPIPGYVRLADIFIIIIYFVATIIGKLLMLFIQSYNIQQIIYVKHSGFGVFFKGFNYFLR